MAKLIIGHTTHNSVKIWVRGEERWPVAFVDVYDSGDRKKGDTSILELREQEFFTATTVRTELSADKIYKIKVSFGKSSADEPEERIREAYTTAKIKTFPRPTSNDKFTFMFGSCNLHSLGFIKNPDKIWTRVSNVAESLGARFMLHCGDQIYADIPRKPRRSPDHYRKKYLDAWEDCVPARRFLTECPHYMILDDHEITNNFDNDMDDAKDIQSLKRFALQTYYEFQHSHNPDTPDNERDGRQYYYQFSYGKAQYFVMDTRTRRSQANGEIIDGDQLVAIKSWLESNRSEIKFIVTSVPFLSQRKKSKGDKWSADEFIDQRNELLKYIFDQDIQRIVFLTGDMHTSYHGSLKMTDNERSITIHELMSSPLNQFTPTTRLKDEYHSPYDSSIGPIKLKSVITASSFYGSHSNVMAVTVDDPRIRYKIYRTSEKEPVAINKSFTI
ncbi:MAG: phosphodiesterase/alkaline phosphatase D-like protein [Parasphingorhabdus sp.]|jgi:phosphodiesterase/alkaline phosphatase D-like protein